jgi:hypothetical protein
MGKPKNLGKDVSLRKLAEELGTHRNRITWALKDDPRVPEEEREKIKTLCKERGYTFTNHPDQHHNDKLTQDRADVIVAGILENKPLATIAANSQLTEHTAFKLIRGVKVPKDYPETEEAWRTDVISFMEIAIWKGTKRLAENGMDEIDSRTVPVSVAILTDKLAVTKGQPTSIHASLSLTANHRDLMKELGTKGQQDVVEVETNAEVLPEGS